jgi:hypothetical protein
MPHHAGIWKVKRISARFCPRLLATGAAVAVCSSTKFMPSHVTDAVEISKLMGIQAEKNKIIVQ